MLERSRWCVAGATKLLRQSCQGVLTELQRCAVGPTKVCRRSCKGHWYNSIASIVLRFYYFNIIFFCYKVSGEVFGNGFDQVDFFNTIAQLLRCYNSIVLLQLFGCVATLVQRICCKVSGEVSGEVSREVWWSREVSGNLSCEYDAPAKSLESSMWDWSWSFYTPSISDYWANYLTHKDQGIR
jgi:hypothetical protein